MTRCRYQKPTKKRVRIRHVLKAIQPTSNDSNEIVCEECGLVIEEQNIDRGPEWQEFNHTKRQNKSRVGAPTTQAMHDKGLTTQID